jgi:hypothetical protein
MNQTDERRDFRMLMVQPDAIPVQGTLYFLDGHYLFRYHDGTRIISKFVTARDLGAAFLQTEQDSGWIAPGIVRMGACARGEWFVYSAPAQKVTIGLSGKLNGNESLTIPIPRTVMMGIDDQYFLWALKDEYFNPGSDACLAPFPNVGQDGKICWGQNHPQKADAQHARRVFDLFFGSIFNGDLAAHKSVSQPNDVRIMLRDLAAKKAKHYPVNDLVTGGKIGSLIENKIKGTR